MDFRVEDEGRRRDREIEELKDAFWWFSDESFHIPASSLALQTVPSVLSFMHISHILRTRLSTRFCMMSFASFFIHNC